MAQASSDRGFPDDLQFTFENEQYVAAAAMSLFQAGKAESARLLLDVSACWIHREHLDFNSWRDAATLQVPSWAVHAFNDERRDEIAGAIRMSAGFHLELYPEEVGVIPELPQADWKPHLKKMLDEGPKNQARLVPLKQEYPQADGMAFRDGAELRMYEALKAKQEALPRDETFTIVPNASIRVPGHTWEPDFLVTYKGHSCVVEVDGGSHNRKYASDKSRDELLQDAGIAFVKRIDRSDAMNDPDLYEFIERTLRKLANT